MESPEMNLVSPFSMELRDYSMRAILAMSAAFQARTGKPRAELRVRELPLQWKAFTLLTPFGVKLQSNGGGGGMGRRRGLKILCPKGRVGSTPTRPTNSVTADEFSCFLPPSSDFL